MKINSLNNQDNVRNQYQNADKLNIRISIHDKYSVNKQGFNNWIMENYRIEKDFRILELGCGNGKAWVNHLDKLQNVHELVLTDFSEGMLDAARETMGECSKITYQMVDIQQIPFSDHSFDMVIANMMLYHVPQIEKALSEVQRVLKDTGTFYCATYGEHGMADYIFSLLQDEKARMGHNKNFTLQNGKEQLVRYFSKVERRDYQDALEINNLDDMLDYIESLVSITNHNTSDRAMIRKKLEENCIDHVLHVPKEYGMFICKK